MLLICFDLSESGVNSLTMGLLLIHLVSLKPPLDNRLRKLLTCAIAFGWDGRDFKQSSTYKFLFTVLVTSREKLCLLSSAVL